ncbi:hypothetical protein [Novosphingobium sp.]|uniref:hypothetical protein n=1 Tax=Novosphingobium sp. TaxID=1874826 RepID=UPI00286E1E78|nr:hypothetical protein [Novosphingobium sp.]
MRNEGKLGLIALSAMALGWSETASAYIGDSFLSIPDQKGHWQGTEHKDWIRAEASEWQGRLTKLNSGATDPLAGNKLFFGGPNVPKPGNGGGKIALSFSKTNADLPALMALCAKKTPIAQLTYAESSDRARPVLELGARPAEFPAFWEYRLKDVVVDDCPVLKGAADQIIMISFRDIQWLNYDPARPNANPIPVAPEKIRAVRPAAPKPGQKARAYLITWIAPATLPPQAEACPVLETKPSEADVYRYLTEGEVAVLKKRWSMKGVSYGPDSERRGPHRMSVASFPGSVPDPVMPEPKATIADGLDLDGEQSGTRTPNGIRKHANFTAPDGRKGIDNQLLRVYGCVPGLRGKQGYGNQTPNARRADGNVVTLIEVSGIDDDKNDGEVEVALIYSGDRPVRDSLGKTFIPNYTFSPSRDPNFAIYNARVKGRIVDGVVMSDPIPLLKMNPGQGPEASLHQARFRIAPQADGSAKVLLGGYQEWKKLAVSSGYSEGLFNYKIPGLYYGFRRHADGLYDPVSGEYNGISMAYEIDTVPAFLVDE